MSPLSIGILLILFACVLVCRHVCISCSCCMRSSAFRCHLCPLVSCYFFLPASYFLGMFALAPPAVYGRLRLIPSLVRWHPAALICLRSTFPACLHWYPCCCVWSSPFRCLPFPLASCCHYLSASCCLGMFALASSAPSQVHSTSRLLLRRSTTQADCGTQTRKKWTVPLPRFVKAFHPENAAQVWVCRILRTKGWRTC
jgi:hypothetical protein